MTITQIKGYTPFLRPTGFSELTQSEKILPIYLEVKRNQMLMDYMIDIEESEDAAKNTLYYLHFKNEKLSKTIPAVHCTRIQKDAERLKNSINRDIRKYNEILITSKFYMYVPESNLWSATYKMIGNEMIAMDLLIHEDLVQCKIGKNEFDIRIKQKSFDELKLVVKGTSAFDLDTDTNESVLKYADVLKSSIELAKQMQQELDVLNELLEQHTDDPKSVISRSLNAVLENRRFDKTPV